MNVAHRWFRSGTYSLLGHTDLPTADCGRSGVLIVPPFGWEDVCSYRSLRCLGQMFAENGIPSLRFDLPGTGDSSGGPCEGGLFEAWIQSVGDAAAELRTMTGVENVDVLGIRLGAMLAVIAAARGSNLQDLILWGATATGRALLRELRAFCKMERSEYANGDSSSPTPSPDLGVGGFLIAPETQHALEAVDLSAINGMQGRRVLVLSRDALLPDAKLVRALEAAGCAVEVGTGSGYAAMMALPHEAISPIEAGRTILEFLKRERQENRPDLINAVEAGTGLTKCPIGGPATAVIEVAGTSVVETIYALKTSSTSIFGILAEPGPRVPRPKWCLLFLNPGAVRHIGPNRMWVEAARRWAARGVVSLRMDLRGIGEGDGEQSLDIAALYQDQLVEQVESVMDSLRSRARFQRFVAVGLCSGAFWAFHAALRNPEIRGAILLNPRLFFWDPEVDRRRLLRRTAEGVADWSDWSRLARGEVRLKKLLQVGRIVVDRLRAPRAGGGRRPQIPAAALAGAWSAFERQQSRIALIFTDGEPLLREMDEEGQLPPETSSCIQCIRIANSGHTFRPLWAQKLAHELIDRELYQLLRENPSDSPLRTLVEADSEVQRNGSFWASANSVS